MKSILSFLDMHPATCLGLLAGVCILFLGMLLGYALGLWANRH